MSNNNLNLWINTQTNTLAAGWQSLSQAQQISVSQGDDVSIEIHMIENAGGISSEIEFPAGSSIKCAIGRLDTFPSSGSFTFTYGANTISIPLTTTIASVNTLINAMASITSAGGVVVTFVNGTTYRLVFNTVGDKLTASLNPSNLYPKSSAASKVIASGSGSVNEIQHLKLKTVPVAYSDTFTLAVQPVVSIGAISSSISRITISQAPKYGNFTISNGSLTTAAISYDATASDILTALTYATISSSSRTYSVIKNANLSWDLSRISGSAETLTVTAVGLVGFSAMIGSINLNSYEVEDLLGGSSYANATLEIELTTDSTTQTIYQGTIKILNDLIDDGVYTPTSFPTVVGDVPSDSILYGRINGSWSAIINDDSDSLAVKLAGSTMNNNATLILNTNNLIYSTLSGSQFSAQHSNTGVITKYKYNGVEFNDGSTQATAGVPLTGGTMSGELSVPQIGNLLNTNLVIDSYNDTGVGTHYYHTFTPFDGKFNLATNGGGMTFPDGTVQTTAYTGGGGGGGGEFLPLGGGTMTGNIYFDGTSGQYIGKGTFDTSRGGNYGISLVCSVGYEFNWQAGWLTTTNQGSPTPRPLYLDSLAGTTLRAWNSETNFGTEVSHTGITTGEILLGDATAGNYIDDSGLDVGNPNGETFYQSTGCYGSNWSVGNFTAQPNYLSAYDGQLNQGTDIYGNHIYLYNENNDQLSISTTRIIFGDTEEGHLQLTDDGISFDNDDNGIPENSLTKYVRAGITFPDGTTLSTAPLGAVTVSTTTSATYNVLLTDVNSVVNLDSGVTQVVLPPCGTSYYNIPIGSQIVFINRDGIQKIFGNGGNAVSILSSGDKYNLLYQYAVCTAICTDVNEWVIAGDLV